MLSAKEANAIVYDNGTMNKLMHKCEELILLEAESGRCRTYFNTRNIPHMIVFCLAHKLEELGYSVEIHASTISIAW